jgi:hypothetical protein
MITSRILGNSRGLVFDLMVGGRLRFDDDCMRLIWGSELMMIRIRNARRSRGLVLGLLVGRTLGFHYGSMSLNSSVKCSIAATNE